MSLSYLCKYKSGWWELKCTGCWVVLQAGRQEDAFGRENESSWLKCLWGGRESNQRQKGDAVWLPPVSTWCHTLQLGIATAA